MKKSNSSATSFARIFDRNREGTELLRSKHKKGNEAEVIVSFTDEEDFDYINGEVDMYDSYGLYSYTAESNIGGCSFLEYDEKEDKAYFKIDVQCDYSSFEDKVRFERC